MSLDATSGSTGTSGIVWWLEKVQPESETQLITER